MPPQQCSCQSLQSGATDKRWNYCWISWTSVLSTSFTYGCVSSKWESQFWKCIQIQNPNPEAGSWQKSQSIFKPHPQFMQVMHNLLSCVVKNHTRHSGSRIWEPGSNLIPWVIPNHTPKLHPNPCTTFLHYTGNIQTYDSENKTSSVTRGDKKQWERQHVILGEIKSRDHQAQQCRMKHHRRQNDSRNSNKLFCFHKQYRVIFPLRTKIPSFSPVWSG